MRGEYLARELGSARCLRNRAPELGVELGKVVVRVDQVERVAGEDGGLACCCGLLGSSSSLWLESLLRLEGLLGLLLHWLRLESLLLRSSLGVLQLPQLVQAGEGSCLLWLLEGLLLNRCCLLESLSRPWLLHLLRLELLEGLLLDRLLRLEGLLWSEGLLNRRSWLLEGLLGRLDPLREPLGRHRGGQGSPGCRSWSRSGGSGSHRGLRGGEELVGEGAEALVEGEGTARSLWSRSSCGSGGEGEAGGQGQVVLDERCLSGGCWRLCGPRPGLATSP